jgi:hypothetical protein
MSVLEDVETSLPNSAYPRIDYRAHPAFRDLGVAPYAHDEEIDALISTIDQALAKLNATHHADDVEFGRAFDRDVAAPIARLQSRLFETIDNERIRAWLARAFEHVSRELRDHVEVLNRRHGSAARTAQTPVGISVAQSLARNGFHISRLEPSTRQTLLDMCAPYMEQLREAAKTRPNDRIVHSFEIHGEVGQQLLGFFRRQGILDGLSGYVGSNVNFTGLALEYSFARQKWWRGVYSDLGIPDSKCTYMHYDQGSRDPKAIIALSEVTKENGPTGYIRGSHKKDRSRFLHFMVTAMDYCFQRDDSCEGIETNYRPRFTREQYRREMLLLPRALHGSSHFGDDVVDDTQLSKELLENEVSMTNDVGNCIVFDGNFGIHRGALVRSGERFVFQVGFDINDPLSLTTRLKRWLRWMGLKTFRGQR